MEDYRGENDRYIQEAYQRETNQSLQDQINMLKQRIKKLEGDIAILSRQPINFTCNDRA